MKKTAFLASLVAILVIAFMLSCADDGTPTPAACVDNDGDTYGANCSAGADCDDGDVDNWDSCTSCLDGDSDTYYVACDAYTTRNGPDCDDSDASINPGATETTCDDVNNDCDAATLDAPDGDNDTWDVCGAVDPVNPDGKDPADCNDSDASINPGAAEVTCDDVDNDCSAATVDAWGGGMYNYDCSPIITNCIMWGDTATTGLEIDNYGASNPIVTYSDVEGGYPGEGNINADPLFVGYPNLHLKSGSPCIDTGTATGAPSDDLDGNPRPSDLGYDMGAYEFQDADGDGIGDDLDNCPDDINSDQGDIDKDGIGDVCDSFPYDPENTDIDGDGLGSNVDNCMQDNNPDQADTDGDGIGDVCDNMPNDPVQFSNNKNMTKYSDKESFLISDISWQDIMSLVPLTTWTEPITEETIKYPTLIYHDETDEKQRFDVDSIIHFFQRYEPTHLTITCSTPTALNDALIDAGLSPSPQMISRINIDSFLSYWDSYGVVVYCEADYELALLASTYASLINAPLVVEGHPSLDVNGTYAGKNVICVGYPTGPGSAYCDRRYRLEQLQELYVQLTNTDKIILVNPNDLSSVDSYIEHEFFLDGCVPLLFGEGMPIYLEEICPDTSPECISNLFSKTSLAAPLLASAKHELIVSTTTTDYQSVDSFIDSKIAELFNSPEDVEYLTIIASAYAIQKSKQEEAIPPIPFFTPGFIPICSALDPYEYADIIGEDHDPDVGVGRIMGFDISDVSSYISRVLFYSDILPSLQRINMKHLSGVFNFTDIPEYGKVQTEEWASIFSNYGYNAESKYGEKGDFISADWEDQDLIHWIDHGDHDWAGIYYNQIPLLDESLVIAEACLTCSRSDGYSFWANAIRKGAIGFAGAVSVSYALDRFRIDMLDNLYYHEKNYSVGKSFSEAYYEGWWGPPGCFLAPRYMWTYIGDPTFNLNPPYPLMEELPSHLPSCD